MEFLRKKLTDNFNTTVEEKNVIEKVTAEGKIKLLSTKFAITNNLIENPDEHSLLSKVK